jgi:GTP-binding protein EngB required for normal cell division
MMESFFAVARDVTTAQLRGVVLIVDARHEPSRDDVSMRDYCVTADLPFCVVANKSDKLKPSQIPELLRKMNKFAMERPMYHCSAVKGAGMDRVRAMISKLSTRGEEYGTV